MANITKRNNLERIGVLVCLMINYMITVISFRTCPWSRLVDIHDSSMFMYFGWGMNHGMTPYLNMFDHKGIVLFWIQQLGNFVGGGSYFRGVWIIECLSYAIFVWFMYRTLHMVTESRLASSLPFLILTPLTVAVFQGGNLSEEYALPFLAIAIWCFLKIDRALTRDRWRYLLGIGITGAAVFFTRPNMIALWVIGCGYLLIRGLIQKDYQRLVKQIAGIFLGGIFVVLIVFLYASLNGSLHQMIYQTFTLNVAYSEQSNNQIRIQAVKFFYSLCKNYGVLLLGIVFIGLGVFSRNQIKSNLIIVVYAGLNFMTVILSGRAYLHYFTTMLPVLYLAAAICCIEFSRMLAQKRSGVVLGLTVGWLGVLMFFPIWPNQSIVPTFRNIVKTQYLVKNNERTSSSMAKLSQFIKTHSTQSDRIYVHRIDANIYLQSQRLANSKFFVLPSLDYAAHPDVVRTFKHRFDSKTPKFVVVKATFVQERQIGIDQFVKHEVKQRYRRVKTYRDADLVLYQLK